MDLHYPPNSCYVSYNQLHIFSSSSATLFTYDTNLSLISNKSINRNMFGTKQSLSFIKYDKVYTLASSQLSIYDFQSHDILNYIKFNQMDSNINSYIIYPLTENSFLLILKSGVLKAFDFYENCLLEFKIDIKKEISRFFITDSGVILVLTSNGV